MSKPRILIFAGSLRVESFNKKLAAVVADKVDANGGEATLIDLRDYRIPPYDGDMEENGGIPERAQILRNLMEDHDALIIASPEYNSSVPGTLKNYIDWTSRPDGDVPGLIAYRGKVAAIMSASPGALGGLRGLVHLRDILENIGVLVIPEQHAVSAANKAFDDKGALAGERDQKGVERVVKRLVEVTGRLSQSFRV